MTNTSFLFSLDFRKLSGYDSAVTALEFVADLVELDRLAAEENDAGRRARILAVRQHLATQEAGAKVSEAATVLGVSSPTVRAWIEAGILDGLSAASPQRVTYTSLAATKRALDEVRSLNDDRPLLAAVGRALRNRAVLDDNALATAIADLQNGRTLTIGPEDLDALVPMSARGS